MLQTEDTILVISPVLDNPREVLKQGIEAYLAGVFDLHEAVVLVVFDDKLALFVLQECSVREDQFAAFEFGVGGQ